jgi:hypothetical protein
MASLTLARTPVLYSLTVVVRKCAVRVGGAFAAICAVLGLSVLPAAHAHTTPSGRTLVHSHLMGHGADHHEAKHTDHHETEHADHHEADHAVTLEHGDHRNVRVLAPTFTVEETLQLAGPVLLEGTLVPPPEETPLNRVEGFDARLTHGPPIRAVSLRAPPA